MGPTSERELRDLLIRVDQNLTNLMVTFGEHIKTDNARFDKHDAEISEIKRLVFMGLGGLFTLEFVLKVFFK